MGNEESEGRIVRYTAEEIDEMIARGEDGTDWDRLSNLTDEDVEASIDFEEEGDFDWDTARVSTSPPRAKQQITFRCDIDLLEWFQRHGGNPEAEIVQVLTDYSKGRRGHAGR